MKFKIFVAICFVFLFQTGCATQRKPIIDVKQQFAIAALQYEDMLLAQHDITKFPQSTNPDGNLGYRPAKWWCSGFFGGSLWYIYEFTGEEKWKIAADKWTKALENEKYDTGTHDLGFKLFCSFGNGYRLTKNKEYVEPLLTGAKSLATRFHPEYGVIKSWDHYTKCDYPVSLTI